MGVSDDPRNFRSVDEFARTLSVAESGEQNFISTSMLLDLPLNNNYLTENNATQDAQQGLLVHNRHSTSQLMGFESP